MVDIPVKFDLLVNSKHTREEQYATIAHELAHLYAATLALRILNGGQVE